MSDAFSTGIQIPNLESGQSRPADIDGFVRVFARQNRLYGVLFNGNEVELTGGALPAFGAIETDSGTVTATIPQQSTFIEGGDAIATRTAVLGGITGVLIDNTDKGSVAVDAHELESDPRPQYQTSSEVSLQIQNERDVYFWSGTGSPLRATSGQRIVQWHGAITTSTGTITFNATTNGVGTGSPIFENLSACSFQVTCVRDTDSNSESPWAHIRRVEDNRRIVVQVKKSNTGPIVLLEAYSGNLNNDNSVVVYLTITGFAA